METDLLQLCMAKVKQKHQERAGEVQRERNKKATFPGGLGEDSSEEATFQLATHSQSNSIPIRSVHVDLLNVGYG